MGGRVSRADKFRRGGLIGWVVGALFSGSLVYSLSPYKGYVAFAICVALAVGIQYLLTIVESVIIHGEIIWPFHKDATITDKVIWAFAFICLAIDAYINYSGIATLLVLVNKTNEGDQDVIKGISGLLSIALALAPEICYAIADKLDGKGRQVNIKQKDKLPFNEDQTLVQSNRDLNNQNNGLRTRLNELEQQLKRANKEQDKPVISIDDNLTIGRRKR